MSFAIGDREVGEGSSTYIIAEAGSNHNGDRSVAEELIEAAADAGADAVKFQVFRASELYVEDSGNVEYLDDERSIYDIIESMEMPYEWIPALHEHCRRNGVHFLATPFDEQSVDELADFVPAWKVASYTATHHPFLRYLADTGKPIVMSTGAHGDEEVRESVLVLRDAGCDAFALLQCVAAYPTPIEDINVRVVETFAEDYGVPTGLSDHTLDPVVAPVVATALGGCLIEKHFTLDRGMEGPDHAFALEPDELEAMITAIRDAERALGDGSKRVLNVEGELRSKARRSLHAVERIETGETLTRENVRVLRSGDREAGLAPKHYDTVLGRRAATDIPKGRGIDWEHVNE